MPPPHKLPEWQYSRAKEILYDDIISGTVLSHMKPAIVYQMHPEYKLYPYKNFPTNLRNLRKAIGLKQVEADRVTSALAHDLQVRIPPNDPLRWNGSAAQKLLLQDIAAGLHQGLKPAQIWSSRPEYKCFDKKKFSNYLHHAANQEVEKAYWLFNNRKRQGKKARSSAGSASSTSVVIDDE